ncbi:MAG: carboxypeptidase regulatory-like domain-containing protein [Planctomycetes bacterium]|nr:carboxypeptidase regulatory-like domain-containing protein [Planctomycetota bacterium]
MNPNPNRSGRSSLLVVVVVLLALLLGIALWIRSAAREIPVSAPLPKAGVASPAGESISVDAPSGLERSAEQVAASADAAKKSEPESGGSGTLRVHVLDEKTHAPIAELGLLVYRERGGDKDLAQGKTDKDGRAEFHDVEANTILVRTERKPPYAESTGGVWLTNGATKELELLVGPGSALTGRVVDDLGKPVAGAGIYLNLSSYGSEPPEPDTRSGPDGRFRFESVALRPRAVWIVDGEIRPERWDGAQLTLMLDNVWASSWPRPVPGKDIDAGDIVLARATTFAGHVLDARDCPVAGALVSLRMGREYARSDSAQARSRWPELVHGPADPEFRLLSRETLTDAAGTFEFRADPDPSMIVVWTRSDQVQHFFKEGGKPGERKEGLELKLKGLTTLELELVDGAGAPAKIPAAFMTLAGLDLPWRTGALSRGKGVSVIARGSDLAEARGEAAARDPDGLWRIQLNIDPASIGELTLAASGYEPITERSTSGFTAVVRRKLVLQECPCFHVRLVPKDPAAKLLDAPGGTLQIHICMADPAQHTGTTLTCCGLGVRWNGEWRGEPLDLLLPVRRKEAFWIYARAQDADPEQWYRYTDVASLGPFEPGTQEHELVLDPAAFVRPAREERKAPEASTAADEADATLRGRVVDAKTGQGISKAGLEFVEAGHSDPFARQFWRDAGTDGGLADVKLPSGRWDISIQKPGYKPAKILDREVRAGETLDLGTIALEPYPVHRGRLLLADGSPPKRAALTVIETGSATSEGVGTVQAEPDGTFRMFGELPPRFLLQALVTALSDGRGAEVQRFVLEPWPDDEVKELHLVPSRRVIVTLAGIDAEQAVLRPELCPAPGEATSTCDHRAVVGEEHQALERGMEIDSSALGQRYLFLLAPGRYQLYGSNLMHALPWTEFEVTPGDTDIELTIPAH